LERRTTSASSIARSRTQPPRGPLMTMSRLWFTAELGREGLSMVRESVQSHRSRRADSAQPNGLTGISASATMPRAGWQGRNRPRRPSLCDSPPFFRSRSETDADRESACSQGPQDAQGEDEDARACRLAAEARRLHARLHDHPEEAE